MSRDALDGTGRVTFPWSEAGYTLAAGAAIALFCSTFLLRDPGYYWHDDFQTAFLPNFCDIARALRNGEFPLRSPFTWQGGAIGGEYQYGIFSVWLLGCIGGVFAMGLPLPMTAAVLSLLHLAVLASGAFRLARRRGMNLAESGVVVLTASLNGWIFIWGAMNWFGHLAAFAWLPWVWWALERAIERREGACRFLPAGLFLYLLIAAGWPFAVVMAGMVSLWLALRNGRDRYGFLHLWPIAAAWLVGLGLSAPAWLMLLEFTPQTFRGKTPFWHLNGEWVVPIRALAGLVFPRLVTEWPIYFHKGMPHRCMEMTGGLAPFIVLAAALSRLGKSFLRRAGWEFGLAGFLLSLCLVPSLGNFRWSFRWLPFFFLTLGLAAGQALALFRQSSVSPPSLGFGATIAVFIVWIGTIRQETIYDRFTVLYALSLLICCLAWTWIERRNPAWAKLRDAMPALIMMAVYWLSYANPANLLAVPTWPIKTGILRDSPLDPDIRYLAAYRDEDILDGPIRGIGIDLYPGNVSLYRGIHFINGYSPLRPLGLTALFGMREHGSLEEQDIARILSREAGSDGLLAFMGVDGLLLSRDFLSFLPQLEQHGWQVKASTADALVLHRQGPPSPRVRILTQIEQSNGSLSTFYRLRDHTEGPLPLVLNMDSPVDSSLVLGQAEVQVSNETRNNLTIEVSHRSPDRSVLVMVAQPWYSGYVARFNGQPIPVHQLNLLVPVVLLPPGANGQLTLEYRPTSLVHGLVIALCTLLGVLVFAALALGRKCMGRWAARRALSAALAPSCAERGG